MQKKDIKKIMCGGYAKIAGSDNAKCNFLLAF